MTGPVKANVTESQIIDIDKNHVGGLIRRCCWHRKQDQKHANQNLEARPGNQLDIHGSLVLKLRQTVHLSVFAVPKRRKHRSIW